MVNDKFLQLHASHEITINNKIETAIISLHGTLRNGEEYFTDMCNAVKEKIESTIVVSPSFKRSDDQKEEDEFFGEEGGIKNGNTATSLKMMIIWDPLI